MSALRRNSFFGFLGFAVPTAIVLIAYPVLVHQLGQEAFGIYLLATSISGVMGFLDFGIAAATLKFIAEDTAREDMKGAAEVLATSFLFYGLLGGIVTSALFLLAPWLSTLFQIAEGLRSSAIWVFRLAAIQFGLFVLTTVLISFFKGLQRFELSTITLSALSIITLGPAALGAALFDLDVVAVTAIGVAANAIILVGCAVYGVRLAHERGIPFRGARPSKRTFKRMASFGGVMTVNSISSVLLYQVQQYLIAMMIGSAAVATYRLATTVPAKVHSVVNSLTEVLFPFSSTSTDRKRLRHVYVRMLIGSGVVALVLLLPMSLFSEFLLTVWLGQELAGQVAPLIPIFALAYFFLALSPAPFHLMNGLGKPWINTVSFAFNAGANIVLILLFNRDVVSLEGFAWAFAIANAINGVAYQVLVEMMVWRKPLTTGGAPS